MMARLFQETETQHPRYLVRTALVVGTMVLIAAFYTESFHGAVSRLAEPVVLLRASVLGDTVHEESRIAYDELWEEHQDLREAYVRARVEANRAEALALEVKGLRDQLQFRAADETRVQATIIRRPPETLYDTLVVAIGSESNVRPGDRVYHGAALLGRVVRVGNELAHVVLASTAGEETNGFLVVGTSTYPMQLTGKGLGAFTSLAPRTTPIEEGDPVLVYTDTWEMLAEVVSVEDAPTDAWLHIDLQSPVNLWHLQTVDIRSEYPGR